MVIFMLVISNLPNKIWSEAVSTVNFNVREQLQFQDIDIDSYESDDVEERELHVPAILSGFDINWLLTDMIEKIQVLTKIQVAS